MKKYLQLLIVLLSSQFLFSQNLVISETEHSGKSEFAFTYTADIDLGFFTDVPNVFQFEFPNKFPELTDEIGLIKGKDVDKYISLSIDGITYKCSEVFGESGSISKKGILLSVTNGELPLTIYAGSEITVTVKNLFNKPNKFLNDNIAWSIDRKTLNKIVAVN